MPERYCGRFAPSPTGSLHFGSLVAAVGSYLEARTRGGDWRVRIEDVDTPRTVPGAADDILRTLEQFGLTWDGEILYQSHRSEAYRAALTTLEAQGNAYPCACSRREIAETGGEGTIYPGTCRNGLPPGKHPRALRVRTDAHRIEFEDRVQGRLQQNLENTVGDFVVRRADGLTAYQLAVVVDDAAQGITDVVRGSDLLDSTPRQIYLQRLLGLPTPGYLHLPVACDARGEKLGKQTRAPAVSAQNPVLVLWEALNFLGQQPPKHLAHASLNEFWDWSLKNWDAARIPPVRTLQPQGF